MRCYGSLININPSLAWAKEHITVFKYFLNPYIHLCVVVGITPTWCEREVRRKINTTKEKSSMIHSARPIFLLPKKDLLYMAWFYKVRKQDRTDKQINIVNKVVMTITNGHGRVDQQEKRIWMKCMHARSAIDLMKLQVSKHDISKLFNLIEKSTLSFFSLEGCIRH